MKLKNSEENYHEKMIELQVIEHLNGNDPLKILIIRTE